MRSITTSLLRLKMIGWLPILVFVGCMSNAPDPAGAIRYYEKGKDPGYEVRLGNVLFQHYCAVCHGALGAGDGFNAYNLSPHPRDLTDPEFQNSLDDRRLADIIRYGGTLRGGSRNMPAWGETLNDHQIRKIVLCIRQMVRKASPPDSTKSQ